jgi:hypothetical protein
MEDITNVTAFQNLAKQKLPKMVYDYYASGAEDEYTLKLNRSAFEQYRYAHSKANVHVSFIAIVTFCMACETELLQCMHGVHLFDALPVRPGLDTRMLVLLIGTICAQKVCTTTNQ